MRLGLSKHLPLALLHKPTHGGRPWRLDRLHFLICVSVFSYIFFFNTSGRMYYEHGLQKPRAALYSLHHDLRVWPRLDSPTATSALSACRRQQGRRPSLEYVQRRRLAAALKFQNGLCRCCYSCQSQAYPTLTESKSSKSKYPLKINT